MKKTERDFIKETMVQLAEELDGHFELTLIGRGNNCDCNFVLSETSDFVELAKWLTSKQRVEVTSGKIRPN